MEEKSLIIYLFISFQWTIEDEKRMSEPIISKFEKEGSPYYSTAR